MDEEKGVYKEKFDAAGNAVVSESPDGGKVESKYDSYGRLTEEKDAEGLVKTYEYDKAGNLTKQKDNAGNESRFTYDKQGKLIREKDAAARTASYSYDTYGNLTQEVSFDQDQVSYEYDVKDQMIHDDGKRRKQRRPIPTIRRGGLPQRPFQKTGHTSILMTCGETPQGRPIRKDPIRHTFMIRQETLRRRPAQTEANTPIPTML